MRWIFPVLIGFGFSNLGFADPTNSKLTCTAFVYVGVPFVTIDMMIDGSGHVEPLGQVTYYGSTRQTAIAENPTNADQLYNLTIEADRPGQELFLEIYKPKTPGAEKALTGRLINPASPAGKEMDASCE